MEPEIIKIKCPHCAVVLSVKPMPGLESKSVTCPNCKTRSKFTEFKLWKPKVKDADKTDYEEATNYNEKTQYSEDTLQSSIGTLTLKRTGEALKLSFGTNIIGRKAQSSQANVQFETSDMHISRQHSCIDIKEVAGKGMVHYLSNAQNKNATFVNGKQINNGDVIILKTGDVIKMASEELVFNM